MDPHDGPARDGTERDGRSCGEDRSLVERSVAGHRDPDRD